MTVRQGSLTTLLLAAFVVAGTAGCESDEAPSTGGVGASYQTLAVQLQNCASTGLDCLQAADCDDAAEQACRDDFHTCRENTRDAYRAFHEAVRACWQTKRECIRDAWSDGGGDWDAGIAAFSACRDEFHACVEVDRPIRPEPGPCMSALRTCVETDVQSAEEGSRRAAFHDCLSAAHECIVNRLPMCDGDEEPEPTDAGPAPTDAGL